MADTLPEGSYEFEEVTKLSEEDAEYIAKWTAEAFSRTDCFNYIAVGKTYAEDPHGHYLLQRSVLDRTAVAGYHVVNKTRTALRTVFPPGHKDERCDVAFTTPCDQNWKLFLEHCGGAEVVKARFSQLFGGILAELNNVYGDDFGLSEYKTGEFAVHPEYQKHGVGSALHKYVADKAKQADKKWFFFSMEYNVPYYEGLGCKIVGEKIPTTIDEAGRKAYPPGNDFMRLCEVLSP